MAGMVDVGEGVLTIVPDTSKFAPLLQSKLGPIFRAATSGAGVFSLAIAGIGAASIKMAADFQDSMTRVQALVGISSGGIQQLSKDVLNLSKTVTPGPVELANALYYVTSAGFRGAEAMSILTDAAKAATAGLGTTSDIADVLTSAMNSYATSGLTASRATNILIAAVREGKTDPAKFATSLGQVLPIAAQMGVSFDQVAAAIASSTREGFFASRAAIGLRYLLASFIRPSQGAAEALNSVGFSVEALQSELRTKGLLYTLRDLAQRLDLSTAAGKEAFATIVGGVRGMSTAAILIGENSKAITGVFDSVKNSAGSLATAFEVSQKRLSVQWKLFVNQVTVAAITLGNALLPIATQIVKVFQAILSPIAKVVGWLAKMPEVVAAAAAAFVGFNILNTILPAISTGISSIAFGMARLGVTSLQTAGMFAKFGTILEASAGELAIYGAAIAAVVIALGKIHGYINSDNEASAQWTKQILAGKASLAEYRKAIDGLAGAHGGLGGIINGNAKVEQAYTQAANNVNKAIAGQYKALTGMTTVQAQSSMLGVQQAQTTYKLADSYSRLALAAQLSTNDNLKLNTTFATLLQHSKDVGFQFTAAQESAIHNAAAAGNLSKAISLVGDAMGYTADQTKDLVKHGATFTGTMKGMAEATKGLSVVTGQSFQEISLQAYNTFVADGSKFGTNWDKMMSGISDSLAQFRADAAKNLDFIGTTFQAMAQRVDANGNPIKMTAQSILQSFKDAAKQTKDFGKNLIEIADIAGGKGKALSAWLLSLGPEGAQAAAIIAGASKKTQEQIANTFNKAQSASQSLADKLTKKIVGTLQSIETILKRIAKAWGVNVNIKTHGLGDLTAAQTKLATLDRKRVINVDVNVHTHAKSPWPDEALQMHLIDPMKRWGFKQIGGVWTVPLAVAVHSGLTPHQKLTGMSEAFTPSSHRVVRVLNGVPIAHGPRPARFSYTTTGAGDVAHAPNTETTHGPNRPLHLHLDRKRFSEQLSYDAMYRGW